jgi:ComF family protein
MIKATAIRVGAILRDATLALLYPADCRVCGAIIESWCDGVACARCWEEIEAARAQAPRCVKCGLPLERLSVHFEIGRQSCGRCEQAAFAHARAGGPYQGALRESVLWLKANPFLAPRLRYLLKDTFTSFAEAQASEMLIPVPLHPTRLRQRGFNQAEVIARALAEMTGLEVDVTSLVRIKASPPQRAGLDALARARSVQGAFRVRAPRLIEGRAVLLIDDVMTTAATAHEIAQTLLASGARIVNVLTLARAASFLS